MDWTEILIAVIGLVFSAIIIPLVKAAFEWLKTKTKGTVFFNATNEMQLVADKVITSLQQTTVADLKAKSADGKLTPDEIKEVAENAFNMFVSDLSDDALDVIESNADDATAYIKNLIESRLFALKNS